MELPDLQMVFVEFGDDGYVEIANVGDTDADVGGVQLCQSATCVDIAPIAAGTIPAGTSILVMASVLGGLAVDGGEAALHSGSDVTNPDTIFGFVQWGLGGVRADVAAEADTDSYCGLQFTRLQFAADRSAQLAYKKEHEAGEPVRVFPFLLEPDMTPEPTT